MQILVSVERDQLRITHKVESNDETLKSEGTQTITIDGEDEQHFEDLAFLLDE